MLRIKNFKTKHLFFITTLFIAMLCVSCGSNNASPMANNANTATNGTASSSSGNAHFSYNLDGTTISGGPTEDMAASFNNQARLTQNDYGKSLAFFLNDASANDNADTYPHSIRFVVKAATGPQQLTADEDHWNVQLFISGKSGGPYIIYGNEAFIVTITNISASHVSGTFSGKFKKATPGEGKDELTVTDGKFDIPVGATAK